MSRLGKVSAAHRSKRNLAELRPRIFAAFLIGDWLLIGAGLAFFLFYRNPASFLIGSLLVGFGQHGLSVLGHEAVHYRICASKRLNDIVGNLLCFMPIGITVGSYRAFHLPHHRAPFSDGDPELALRRAMGGGFRPPYTVRRGVALWALSFVGGSVRELLVFAVTLPRPRNREAFGLAAFALGAIASAVFLDPALLALWFYSLATTFISKVRVQGWFEHGLVAGEGNRYALPSPFFRAFVPHNIWVHFEHHRHPEVPFYNLEALRTMDADSRIYEVSEMGSALRETPAGILDRSSDQRAA